MRRELVIALLILLAGCSGLNGGVSPARTPDVASPVQTTTAGPSGDAPADATASNTVNYTDLSAAERRVFDAAKEETIGFAPASVSESPYVNRSFFPTDHKEVFQNHEYVQQNDSYYVLSWELGPTIASYHIQTTEHQPPANATVVTVGNLAPSVREPIREAIENGSYDTPWGKWNSLPESVDGVDYVRDGETHYELTIIVGDFWPDEMTATSVE